MMITSILEELVEHKAQDILTLDISEKTPLIDTLIICTATSNRHARSLAELLIRAAKRKQRLPVGVEGLDYGEWILVNLGAIIVHIMSADKRNFYQIDKVWTSTNKENG